LNKDLNIINRKATHDFNLLESYVAGIILTGTEIKSVRMGKVNMSDAFCYFKDGELFVRNMHISDYDRSSFYKHDPKRPRKLLLTKRELKKLNNKVKEKGFTIAPVRLFLSDTGYAKLEISLAKGKNTYDKRDSLKEKDLKREMSREQ
jgi:SsrA-binding protein